MVYRHFRARVAVQVGLILAVCALVAYLAVTTTYYATMLLLVVALGLQTAALLRYVQRTNREIGRFLLAVQHADFAQSFETPGSTGSFGELGAAFEDVMRRFRAARAKQEQQAGYLDAVVEHIPIAVLAVDETGRVDLFNEAAKQLLGTRALRSLHEYRAFGDAFAARLMRLEHGSSELIEVRRDSEALKLNATATSLTIGEHDYRIISLQDISRQLEASELTAWQNLIRVLTHEIMNSVTPISSLASTAGEILADARNDPRNSQAIDDAKDAVDTIAQRSDGLLHFVEGYRQLTRMPEPELKRIRVADVISRIRQLMRAELESRGIGLEESVAPPTLEVDADAQLIEQALINLVRNAIEALDGAHTPEIRITASVDAAGHVTLAVADNGSGITDEARANVFVPFYTTKRDGSGIGLSLVRQIMRAHGGHAALVSAPGEGTTIRLSFAR